MNVRRLAVAIGCAFALAGCGTDLNPNGLVVTPVPSTTVATSIWTPAKCPPLPESNPDQRSDLTFTGTCAFHQAGSLLCHSSQDDFFMSMRRILPGALPLTLYVNVERYHGPGTYTGDVQVFVYVQDSQNLFRWYNVQSTLTVGANEATAVLTPVDLQPEPGTPAVGTESISGSIGCLKG